MTATVPGVPEPDATGPTATGRVDRWALAAAVAVTAAGALHLVAALDHLGHDVRFAAFFLGVGALQAGIGPGLHRGATARRLWPLLAGTLALLLLYLHSRTVGLHIGPHADRPEDPDALGLSVVTCELIAVAALTALLPPGPRRWAVNGLFAIGVSVWGLWLLGVLN